MGLWENFKYADKKKKLLYIVLLLIILLLIIFGGIWISKLKKPVPVIAPQPTLQQDENSDNVLADTVNPISVQQEILVQDREMDVRIIAEPFVERFGSFNNQDGLKNFDEIEIFMTDSLREWVNSSYRNKLTDNMPPINEYYAINTKVLSSETIKLNEADGEAEILMNTQRQEIGSIGVESNVVYQEVRVEMIKEGDKWLVKGVFWL